MKNNKYLLVCLFLTILAPPSASAGYLGDFVAAIFGVTGSGTAPAAHTASLPKQNYETCRQVGEQYVCNEVPRPYITNAVIEDAKQQMRAVENAPAPSQPRQQAAPMPQDDNRSCQTFGHCVQCPGPEHPMSWQSPKGNKITLLNAGQNRMAAGIRRVLDEMADKKGKGITVSSGFRSCQRNAQVGGVPKSQHLKGNAADFMFSGSGEVKAQLSSFARQTLDGMGLSGIGGTGTYCHTNAAHVDTGNKRNWVWSCR